MSEWLLVVGCFLHLFLPAQKRHVLRVLKEAAKLQEWSHFLELQWFKMPEVSQWNITEKYNKCHANTPRFQPKYPPVNHQNSFHLANWSWIFQCIAFFLRSSRTFSISRWEKLLAWKLTRSQKFRNSLVLGRMPWSILRIPWSLYG